MRVAAEAADHRRVLLGPLERRALARVLRERAEQRERALLRRQRPRRARTAGRGTSARRRRARDRSRASIACSAVASATRVAGERARRVAKDVARELVEQQHARERAVRGRAPAADARRPARSSTAAPKRARIAASNAGSLRNQTSRVGVRRRAEPEVEDPRGRGSIGQMRCDVHRAIRCGIGPAGGASTSFRTVSQPASDADLLPQHLPARLLPGAAAHQRARA